MREQTKKEILENNENQLTKEEKWRQLGVLQETR